MTNAVEFGLVHPQERFLGCLLGLACGDAVGTSVEFAPRVTFPPQEILSTRVQSVADADYTGKTRKEIRGSGYCVASLEAALWCFEKTNSFEQAVLTAANLGEDADTTAAICGQIAGAYYGVKAIPSSWIDRLAMREEIEQLALSLANNPYSLMP